MHYDLYVFIQQNNLHFSYLNRSIYKDILVIIALHIYTMQVRMLLNRDIIKEMLRK